MVNMVRNPTGIVLSTFLKNVESAEGSWEIRDGDSEPSE